MRPFSEIFKSLLINSGRILLLLHMPQWSKTISSCMSYLYTGTIQDRFRHFGRNSIIRWKAMNLVGLEHIIVNDNTTIGKGAQIEAWGKSNGKPKIVIGKNCQLREYIHITAIKQIIIGDDVLTGNNVLISDNSHGETDMLSMTVPPAKREITSKGEVTIGNRVWLGNNVCVLSGVHIGEGSVIGANSVVTHDIPPFCVAAGIPAHILRKNNSSSNQADRF